MNYIELKNLQKDYKTGNIVFTALKNVNLKISKGSFVVLKGASGSGKSTLLNLLSGIDLPTSGELVVNNTAIQKLSSQQQDKWRGLSLGIVFQFFQLMPTLTVLENIILPMEFVRKYSKQERKGRALRLLEKVKIDSLANKYPQTLSGGEKQRVAIARALANNPDLLIADEPTGNLDSKTGDIVLNTFKKLNKEHNRTIILITHEQDIANYAERIIHIKDGDIISDSKHHKR